MRVKPERVIAALKEKGPMNSLEIAEALGVKPWKLGLKKLEDEGKIEWRRGGWHVKEVEE